MSVVKPWMVALPEPLTSHSLLGLPGCVFSHATGLTTGGSHGAASAGVAVIGTSPTPMSIPATTT